MKFIPVRQSTFEIGSSLQAKDVVDFSDVNRYGSHVVGGLFVNQGNDSVIINEAVTLATGDSMPITVQAPYADKSVYTVRFLAGVGSVSRRLVLIIYKAYPQENI